MPPAGSRGSTKVEFPPDPEVGVGLSPPLPLGDPDAEAFPDERLADAVIVPLLVAAADAAVLEAVWLALAVFVSCKRQH
jgi:hypothetical protein